MARLFSRTFEFGYSDWQPASLDAALVTERLRQVTGGQVLHSGGVGNPLYLEVQESSPPDTDTLKAFNYVVQPFKKARK